MNKQLFVQVGITEKDYKNYCRLNKIPHYKKEVKRQFFADIRDGKLVKNSITGKIEKKEK